MKRCTDSRLVTLTLRGCMLLGLAAAAGCATQIRTPRAPILTDEGPPAAVIVRPPPETHDTHPTFQLGEPARDEASPPAAMAVNDAPTLENTPRAARDLRVQ